MQLPIIPHPYPKDLIISESEAIYLNAISEPLFKILNEQYPESIILESDTILCLVILICRHNAKYPTIDELINPILKLNTHQHS